jgi:hypothetical protein
VKAGVLNDKIVIKVQLKLLAMLFTLGLPFVDFGEAR